MNLLFPTRFLVYFLIIISILETYNCLRFELKVGTTKCLKEEVHKDVLVTGTYELSDTPGHKTNIKVQDSRTHILYQKEGISKGKFAFTTEEYELFDICFESINSGGGQSPDREVFIDVKHGVEAKNYDAMAKAEKLKPMELELKRLEDLSNAVVSDFEFMRLRETQMRDTNVSTHSRVLYLSIFSMLCLFLLATWQVLYLRRFFKSKKLIE